MSTRQIILEAIKQANEATVDELARAADVSPVTARHHLNSLLAEGLLESRSVRRKVGRPYFVYSLSDRGEELFPQRYVSLSSRLLDALKARLPAEMIHDLLTLVVERIVEENRFRFERLSFEERLDFLVRLLAQEGFLASWKQDQGQYELTEHNCPYYSIGKRHSEVCTFDTQLISLVLEAEIIQHHCVLQGDSCCQFTLTAPAPAG